MENPNIELIAPEQKKPSGAKKALNVIKNILVILIVAVSSCFAHGGILLL